MKKCSYCGKDSPDDAHTCPGCGTVFPALAGEASASAGLPPLLPLARKRKRRTIAIVSASIVCVLLCAVFIFGVLPPAMARAKARRVEGILTAMGKPFADLKVRLSFVKERYEGLFPSIHGSLPTDSHLATLNAALAKNFGSAWTNNIWVRVETRGK